MKKILKVMTVVIATMVVSVLAIAYLSLNTFSPDDPEVEVDAQKLAYFQKSYEESRKAFVDQSEKLKNKYQGIQIFSSKVPSKIDQDLSMEFCYLPAQKKTEKLLILTSGVHGVEGFVGSAVQQMFMNEVLELEMLDEVGILMVHGINPYGFKYTRKVTENNIDFNRNCDVEKSLFQFKNEGYNDLADMLNPVGEVNSASFRNKFFMVDIVNRLLQESMSTLRQAALQGQYQHAKGIYYGGSEFEPQLGTLGEIFKTYAKDYNMVFNIDLHTGYGERGTSHLFPNPIKDEKVKSSLEEIFEGYKIDWGDSDDFYLINGSFTDYIGKLFPEKYYMPMLLEYGTLNSQTTLGSVKSIHNMILENQGANYGFKNPEDKIKVEESFMEMYNPSSEKWRTKIMIDSKEILKNVMNNYSAM